MYLGYDQAVALPALQARARTLLAAAGGARPVDAATEGSYYSYYDESGEESSWTAASSLIPAAAPPRGSRSRSRTPPARSPSPKPRCERVTFWTTGLNGTSELTLWVDADARLTAAEREWRRLMGAGDEPVVFSCGGRPLDMERRVADLDFWIHGDGLMILAKHQPGKLQQIARLQIMMHGRRHIDGKPIGKVEPRIGKIWG